MSVWVPLFSVQNFFLLYEVCVIDFSRVIVSMWYLYSKLQFVSKSITIRHIDFLPSITFWMLFHFCFSYILPLCTGWNFYALFNHIHSVSYHSWVLGRQEVHCDLLTGRCRFRTNVQINMKPRHNLTATVLAHCKRLLTQNTCLFSISVILNDIIDAVPYTPFSFSFYASVFPKFS